MYTYYDQYVKSTGDADAQDRWARQLIWEVARHAIGEELVIYPLMERHLGAQGQRLADEDRADHQVRRPKLSLGSPVLIFSTLVESQGIVIRHRVPQAWFPTARGHSQVRYGAPTTTQRQRGAKRFAPSYKGHWRRGICRGGREFQEDKKVCPDSVRLFAFMCIHCLHD
jgi:hypothetical protein